MTRDTLIKTIWVLFAALFFTVQGFTQAHATSNGGDDHTHDGVVCELSLASAQQNIATPPLPITLPFSPPIEANWDVIQINTIPRSFDGRAPPPRGPPTH